MGMNGAGAGADDGYPYPAPGLAGLTQKCGAHIGKYKAVAACADGGRSTDGDGNLYKRTTSISRARTRLQNGENTYDGAGGIARDLCSEGG